MTSSTETATDQTVPAGAATSAAVRREELGRRLLRSSSKNSYDPFLDIDWDAPVDQDKAFLPLQHVTLYGTELWQSMSEQQRIELSKHELASVAGTGLWFEIILVHMLARYAFHEDPQAAHTQYALTEVGDETRHIIMFAKAIDRMGVPTYRPPWWMDLLARLYKATARGVTVFAPVLVAEEVTDRLQRTTMHDDSINPLIRMVNRIHVVEESRHVRFGRDEVARLMPRLRGPKRVFVNILSAVVSACVVHSLISPDVYKSVRLDRDEALRQAQANPNRAATRRFLGEKIMAFFGEQGLITWYTRPIYRRVDLI